METVGQVALAAQLVTTGLMAGIYLAFSIAVMPGLARTEDRTYVLSMRGMNAAILNGWFFVVFLGPLLFGVVAAGSRLDEPEDLGWVALAVALYVVTLLVTAIVNVPLNNQLDSTELVEDARGPFEKRWVRWNAVRTVVCIASFVALVPAAAQLS